MKTLSVAVIGCGNIAGGFDQKRAATDSGIYSHAGAYAAHGGFELKAVFDTNVKRAEEFIHFWQAGRIADSVDELFRMRPDIISLCTPDETHFQYLTDILTARCCDIVFVEKPLAFSPAEIKKLIELSDQTGVKLIVNFQRRWEAAHQELRVRISKERRALLSATAHYMKGLRHIGVTMIDTICFICGYPDAVMAFNRVLNQETDDYSYEFVLYYPDFSVVVKTTDSIHFTYSYHVFELDLLFADGRTTLVDISQGRRVSKVTDYAYSGVKILNDRESTYFETAYKKSMVDAAAYVYGVATGAIKHTINTPQNSYNNAAIIEAIVESYKNASMKMVLEPALWKK